MDTTALRQAISGLPNAEANAALVQATGPDGCWTGTSGVADIHTGAGVPQTARFRIGSVTKVFTATVVLQLVAEQRISLDGTVQQYLPGLLPVGCPAVTVRQLLNYTSGLPSPALEDNADIEYVVNHRFDHGHRSSTWTRDGRRRLTYGLTVNDAKNVDNPSTIPQRIVAAGMTLSATTNPSLAGR